MLQLLLSGRIPPAPPTTESARTAPRISHLTIPSPPRAAATEPGRQRGPLTPSLAIMHAQRAAAGAAGRQDSSAAHETGSQRSAAPGSAPALISILALALLLALLRPRTGLDIGPPCSSSRAAAGGRQTLTGIERAQTGLLAQLVAKHHAISQQRRRAVWGNGEFRTPY